MFQMDTVRVYTFEDALVLSQGTHAIMCMSCVIVLHSMW